MISPIKLQSVSKSYRIYNNPQDRFKQALLNRLRTSLGAMGHDSHNAYYREHWALKDISLELRPGEAVGILGRNGAGKSTLLQIIAGTLAPTSGSVHTNGRITALLELGSGFNLEFTGRENVFMNASILGLTREETAVRFDEIAAFADIGDFIDQPVKTYSSGMMMRLAFAVQTAVQPSVLIIDEALAVGDIFFQIKCMTRLKQLLDNGVSLLFVSHSVDTVRQLCGRAILLDAGRIVESGEAGAVADVYQRELLIERNNRASTSVAEVPKSALLSLGESDPIAMVKEDGIQVIDDSKFADDSIYFGVEAFRERAAVNRVQNGMAEILNVQLLRQGHMCQEVGYNEEVVVRIVLSCKKKLPNVNISLKISTLQGMCVAFCDSRLVGEIDRAYEESTIYAISWNIKLPMMHGKYIIGCGIAFPPNSEHPDWRFVDMIPCAYSFRMRPREEGLIGGIISIPAAFSVAKIGDSV